jgi:hypothetical protein
VAKELEIREEEIEARLSTGFGWQLSKPVVPVRVDDPRGNGAALERIVREAPALAGIAVLIGERRAPIRAMAIVFRKIWEASGGNLEVLLLLANSRDAKAGEPVHAEHLKAWRNFLAIHDLHFGLERWGS